MRVDLAGIGGSALTDWSIALPEAAAARHSGQLRAGAQYHAAGSGAGLGRSARSARSGHRRQRSVDYSGYPDCRPEFIRSFEALAALATKAGVEGARFSVHAPLIAMSKAQIIRSGLEWGVDYAMTVSCYQADADGRACGRCDSCRLRREGFAAAGVRRSDALR